MGAISSILEAMRADNIPENHSGIWSIYKPEMPKSKRKLTLLFADTLASMHKERGECVMVDTSTELKTHLNFILKAKGRVIVSGLGLGCVVRGLLTKSNIESITVIERDKHVIDMVLPHMPQDSRLKIINDCAIKYSEYGEHYDYGWHDIWSNPDDEEPHLATSHAKIMCNSVGSIEKQGAWGLHSSVRTMFSRQQWWYQ